MATTKISIPRPASVAPHECVIEGWYQSRPPDAPPDFDLATATWSETFHFQHSIPWSELNVIIANVGVNDDQQITISGGVDVSRFLIRAAVPEDRQRLATLFADEHRALTRDYISALTLWLMGAVSDRPTSP